MKIHDSALKHGIRAEDSIQAATWALWIEDLDDDDSPARQLRLGFDTQGLLSLGFSGEQLLPNRLTGIAIDFPAACWEIAMGHNINRTHE